MSSLSISLASSTLSDGGSSSIIELVGDEDDAQALLSPKSSGKMSALAPQKRQTNDLSTLTINKLRFHEVGIQGRDKEKAILEQEFKALVTKTDDDETSKEKRVILIGGNSGSGKSILADTLQAQVKQHKGLFAKGKFDLNLRNEPYYAFATACTEICEAILQLKETQKPLFNHISTEIKTILWAELSLLAQVIPAIDKVIGKNDSGKNKEQEAAGPPLGEAKNRINFAFLRLFRIITKEFHPLVLVLDDLQWADGSSLELLEFLLSDNQNPNKYMIIGIYRSNEVHKTHIFYKCIQELQKKNKEGDFSLIKMEILDLAMEAVDRIIQDLLHCQGDKRTLSLAQLCWERTHGNPFFVLRYLEMLHEKKFLDYNLGTLSWHWNVEEISTSTQASDNVVELLKSKMVGLSPHLLNILKASASLGSTFDLSTLELVWNKLDEDTIGTRSIQEENGGEEKTNDDEERSLFLDGLEHLEGAGLIVKASDQPPRHKWVHDKIYEAALGLVPETERAAWNRQIGELLVAKLSEAELNAAIFVVVNLLNHSPTTSIETVEGQLNLARLNYDACLKAMNVSAFESGAEYAAKGISYLPENSWLEHYDLTLKLYSTGAKAEGFIGNVETMERYCEEVLAKKDHPLEDKLGVYHTLTDSLFHRGNFQEAVNLLIDVLDQFKCRFPKNTVAVTAAIYANVFRIQATMKTRDPESFTPLNDEIKLELLWLQDKLTTVLYIARDERLPLVVFRSLNWTVEYGYSDLSAPAFATTGMILVGATDDLRGGAIYGQHALDLLEKTRTKSGAARTLFIIYSFIFSWTKPTRDLIKPLLHTYDIGLQTGDTESACFSSFHYMVYHMNTGTSLQTIAADMFLYGKQMKDLKRHYARRYTEAMQQAILNLMGRDNVDDPTRFTGQAVSEKTLDKSRLDPFLHAGLSFYQGLLFTYFNEHDRHVDIVIENGVDHLAKAHVGSPNVCSSYFLKGISCFATARQTGKSKYAKLGQQCRAKMKKWLGLGNPNIKHYVSLLEAEFCAFKGSPAATKHFEVAIQLAARGGYQQDAALASERLAEYQFEVMRDTEEGMYRIREAIKYWGGYGAEAKVAQLEKKYFDEQPLLDEMGVIRPKSTCCGFGLARRATAPNMMKASMSHAEQTD